MAANPEDIIGTAHRIQGKKGKIILPSHKAQPLGYSKWCAVNCPCPPCPEPEPCPDCPPPPEPGCCADADCPPGQICQGQQCTPCPEQPCDPGMAWNQNQCACIAAGPTPGACPTCPPNTTFPVGVAECAFGMLNYIMSTFDVNIAGLLVGCQLSAPAQISISGECNGIWAIGGTSYLSEHNKATSAGYASCVRVSRIDQASPYVLKTCQNTLYVGAIPGTGQTPEGVRACTDALWQVLSNSGIQLAWPAASGWPNLKEWILDGHFIQVP